MRAALLLLALAGPAWGQVAPLSVTLRAEAPCPAPAQRAQLLALPTGCPSPWAGVLYTDGEHDRTRQEFATLEAVARARREQLAQRDEQLQACRRQRDEQGRACTAAVIGLRAVLDAWTPPAPVEPRPAWPWALVAGGLTVIGATIPSALDRGTGEVLGYALAGAAVGGVVAVVVDLVER